MSEINEYINKLKLYDEVIKKNKTKKDSDFLELIRNQIYFKLKK